MGWHHPPSSAWHLLAGGQPAMVELAMAAELFAHSTSQRVQDSNLIWRVA